MQFLSNSLQLFQVPLYPKNIFPMFFSLFFLIPSIHSLYLTADGNSGSADAPFQTLRKARDAIRATRLASAAAAALPATVHVAGTLGTSLADARAAADEEVVGVTVDVRNGGACAGAEVVQLCARDPEPGRSRAPHAASSALPPPVGTYTTCARACTGPSAS